MKYTLSTFYKTKDWTLFRLHVMDERITKEGHLICEYCGKPIVRSYDCIAHHCNVFLTEENVNDVTISLNPDNIQLVHHKCHNLIHDKLGYTKREVFIVYGSPMSGKSSYVEDVREIGDLIIDMDSIWQCVSGCDKYDKPARLNAVVFGVRDKLLECVRYRVGKWNNAYVIGGYPLISERERLCQELGAREIFVDTPKDECLARLEACEDGRKLDEWRGYIEDWWRKYHPPS